MLRAVRLYLPLALYALLDAHYFQFAQSWNFIASENYESRCPGLLLVNRGREPFYSNIYQSVSLYRSKETRPN